MLRVDGKAFHTFTRDMNRPFDQSFIDAMVVAAKSVAAEAQGCKLAYVQSDEASFLLTDYDSLHTDAWFDYNISKMVSVAASVMTSAFNVEVSRSRKGFPPAHFDCRAFSVPREEVANYLLWRAKDWERNSISMYCRAFFLHEQLNSKSKIEQHDMLHGIGKNWTTDLSPQLRNGTWIIRNEEGEWVSRSDVIPMFEKIERLAKPLVNCDKDVKS